MQLVDDSSTGTGNVSVYQSVTIASATDYTFSAYLKADQLSWVALNNVLFDTGGTAWFDLANGVVGTVAGSMSDAGIEYAGDGWYRCWAVFQSTTDLAGQIRFYPAPADNTLTVDLDGTSSILVWGAQLEAGSFPTTYQPTAASSVARNADVLTYSATGNADSFPMTVSVDVTPSVRATLQRIISVDDNSANNRVQINLNNGISRLYVQATTAQASIDDTSVLIIGGTSTLTGAVAVNDVESYTNGVSVGTPDTSATMPSGLLEIDIGSYSSAYANGNIRNVKIFNKRLNDSQVKTL
jgi:hypothetical protein